MSIHFTTNKISVIKISPTSARLHIDSLSQEKKALLIEYPDAAVLSRFLNFMQCWDKREAIESISLKRDCTGKNNIILHVSFSYETYPSVSFEYGQDKCVKYWGMLNRWVDMSAGDHDGIIHLSESGQYIFEITNFFFYPFPLTPHPFKITVVPI